MIATRARATTQGELPLEALRRATIVCKEKNSCSRLEGEALKDAPVVKRAGFGRYSGEKTHADLSRRVWKKRSNLLSCKKL